MTAFRKSSAEAANGDFAGSALALCGPQLTVKLPLKYYMPIGSGGSSNQPRMG
jgi:hypothetical protein